MLAIPARLPETPFAWGLALGGLPVAAGLVFRTYTYHVSIAAMEALRQFDAIFVLFELFVGLHAIRNRALFSRALKRLKGIDHFAIVVFMSTFWISSIFISEWPAMSSVRIAIWFVHILFALSVYELVTSAELPEQRSFARGALLGLCLYIPVLAIHFASAPHPSTLPENTIIWTSALPGYLSVRLFGFTTSAMALLFIGLLWVGRSNVKRDWWIYLGLVLSLTLTFWSGTRGGYYAVLLATLAMPILARVRPRLMWIAGVASCALTAMAISELLPHPNQSFGMFRDETLVAEVGFSTGRLEMWTWALGWIAERPLLGWGESAMIWLTGQFGIQQPHNALLQMALSWGLIATCAAVYLGVKVARVIFLDIHLQAVRLIPATVLLGLAIMASVDGVLYNPRTTMLLIFAAASALAMAVKGSRKQGEAATG